MPTAGIGPAPKVSAEVSPLRDRPLLTFSDAKHKLAAIEGMRQEAIPRLAALAVLCKPPVDGGRMEAWNAALDALCNLKPFLDEDDDEGKAALAALIWRADIECYLKRWEPAGDGLVFRTPPASSDIFLFRGIQLLRLVKVPFNSKTSQSGACALIASALKTFRMRDKVLEANSVERNYFRIRDAHGKSFRLSEAALADLDAWVARLEAAERSST